MRTKTDKQQIEYVQLSALTPYARNSRTHSPEQVKRIAASIREFGFTNPVLIDADGTIIAGHGRVLAAQHLQLDTVPVVRLEYMTEQQKRAYVIADNRLALDAGWDEELLRVELDTLHADGYDVAMTGFGADELAELMKLDIADKQETDEDEVPEPPAEPTCKTGDIWQLGAHRLMCGDSTNAEHVQALMNGSKARLVVTSPPYMQQRAYTNESTGKLQDWHALMMHVFSIVPVQEDAQMLVNIGLVHRDGSVVQYWNSWIESMQQMQWRLFGWYVWDQGAGMPGDWNGRLAPSHEFVFHFNKQAVQPIKARECKHAGVAHGGKGMRAANNVVQKRSHGNAPIQSHAIHDSVLRVNRQGASHDAGGHPAPYPVGLPAMFIESWDGDIYEPFAGSGTTIIAAEQLQRACFAIEISPAYCDVIIARWEKYTGLKAQKL